MALLNNITGKITKNADKIGMLAGAYGYLAESGKGAGLDAFGNAQRIIESLMSEPHFPNIGHVVADLKQSDIFMTAVKAGLIGYILQELKLHPELTKIGRLLMKGGFGAAKGSAITTTLAYSSVFHSPDIRTTSGGSQGSHTNSGYSY